MFFPSPPSPPSLPSCGRRTRRGKAGRKKGHKSKGFGQFGQAAEFGIRSQELQGRLDEVLDVQKVLEVVEEGRKMADVDLLRELFWKSESLKEEKN